MPTLKPYTVSARFHGSAIENWTLESFHNLSEAINSAEKTRRSFSDVVFTQDSVFIEIKNKGDTVDYSDTLDGLTGDLLLTLLSTNGKFSAVIVCQNRGQIDSIDTLLTRKNEELPTQLSRVAPHALGIGSRSVRFLLPGAILAGYEFDLAILIDCDTVDPRWLEDLGNRIRPGGQVQAYRSKRNALERNVGLEYVAMRVTPAKPRNTTAIMGDEEVTARLEYLEKSLGDLTGMVKIVSKVVLRRTSYLREIMEWIKSFRQKK